MDQELKRRIYTAIDQSDFILAGIGEEFALQAGNREQMADSSGGQEKIAEKEGAGGSPAADSARIVGAYNGLLRVFRGRPYFVLTQNKDNLIFQSKIPSLFISAPCCECPPGNTDPQRQWNAYLNWLSSVPSRRACLMLLGVGIMQPQIIRWPFEKSAQIAQKSKLITVHHSLAFLPEKTDGRGIAVKENAVKFIEEISGREEPS